MRPLRQRRTHLLAVAGILAVTGVATPFATAANAGQAGHAADAAASQDSGGDDLVAEGKALFATGCASCHGPDGAGITPQDGGAGGPSLLEAGEAAAYFQLTTGRMPATSSDQQPVRKEPAYFSDEIDALVAYVASLGDGPALPDIDLTDADLAQGGVIYRANCQACHSASGSGGALSYGRAAPRLSDATPEQIAAAVRTGPSQMPVFDADIVDGEQLDDLISYVRYLDNPEDPGGLPIGRTGPIPEGFVAWLVGMVALVGLVVWIGSRSPIVRDGPDGSDGPDESRSDT